MRNHRAPACRDPAHVGDNYMIILNALHTLFTDVLVLVIVVLNSIIINRQLGPEMLGAYYLATSFAAIAVNLFSFGINASNSILIAKDREAAAVLFVHSFLLSGAVGFLTIPLLLAGGGMLTGSVLKGIDASTLVPVVLSIPVLLYQSCWSALMVGLGEITLLNRYNVYSNLFLAAVSFAILVGAKAGLRELLYAMLSVQVLLAVFSSVLFLRRHRGGRPLRVDVGTLRRSLDLGLKTHAGNIAHYLFLRMDYFLVNYFLGASATGYYGLATSLAERIWMVVGPIYTATMSQITASAREKSIALVVKILRVVVFLLALLAAGLAAAGPLLIPLLYGRQFLPAYVPLAWLLPGVVFFGASWFLGLFFIGQLTRPEITSKIAWFGLAISIPLYVGLIRLFGIVGAAAASTLVYLFIFGATFATFLGITGRSAAESLLIRKSDFQEILGPLAARIFTSRRAA